MRLTTLALDLVVVLAFAFAGNRSHYGEVTMAGVLQTTWPFALALLAGWLIAGRTRWALRSLRSGLLIWLTTVIGGMLLRLLTGAGTAWTFVGVATLVLGAGLLGWRFLVALPLRQTRLPRQRHGPQPEPLEES